MSDDFFFYMFLIKPLINQLIVRLIVRLIDKKNPISLSINCCPCLNTINDDISC